MTSNRSIRVLGIAGSLRRGSFNRSLLRAAGQLGPAGMRIDPFDIGELPLYNADLDNDDARPESVRRLKAALAEADGLLLASPEYNHSVPGVMQNALDWVSRPAMKSPLVGKPVAIMGAAAGPVGTARGQQVLKLTLLSTLCHLMPHPGVVVAKAGEKFSDTGELTDEATRAFLRSFLTDFVAWVQRMNGSAGDVRVVA